MIRQAAESVEIDHPRRASTRDSRSPSLGWRWSHPTRGRPVHASGPSPCSRGCSRSDRMSNHLACQLGVRDGEGGAVGRAARRTRAISVGASADLRRPGRTAVMTAPRHLDARARADLIGGPAVGVEGGGRRHVQQRSAPRRLMKAGAHRAAHAARTIADAGTPHVAERASPPGCHGAVRPEQARVEWRQHLGG